MDDECEDDEEGENAEEEEGEDSDLKAEDGAWLDEAEELAVAVMPRALCAEFEDEEKDCGKKTVPLP